MKSFFFVGYLILFISRVEQSTNLRSQQNIINFRNIAYNLQFTNSGVHEHVHRRQTTKFRAHEKSVHSTLYYGI